ncbi:AAA family ATPase, partial [Micromonospora yasonensis]|uniref:AAA domain-containing protein n=1 Tax=Micromonospora yasonensis TaxID=1128667 RepID=UPI002231F97C
MRAGLAVPPAVEAERVITAVLADLRSGDHRGVVVDSPPGAGKSTLVVRAATELAATGEPLIIVAQTNEQVDDLIDRLVRKAPELRIGRLSAADYRPSDRVKDHATVRVAAKVADLGGPTVTIGTAAKWATIAEGTWPWAIVDEAYQMRSDALLRVAGRFERALFVGDPGQLDPFSTVETARWTGLTWDPMQSAVATLLRHNPDLPVHRLPVSWRLPATAAPVVAAAFYPFTGFRAGTGLADRALAFTEPGPGDQVDATVEVAARTGWGLYELPARHTLRTDGEAATA